MLKKTLLALVVSCMILAAVVYAQQTPNAQQTPVQPGRYSLGGFKLASNPEVPIIIKLDSATGESWYLSTNRNQQGVFTSVQWTPIK